MNNFSDKVQFIRSIAELLRGPSRKITIEQPLRLNFQTSPERIERLREAKPFQSLATSKKKGKEAAAEIAAGKALQEAIIDALKTLEAGKVYKKRDAFGKDLATATNDVKATASTAEAITRLTEYRQAVITAAVTGKIDVRKGAEP